MCKPGRWNPQTVSKEEFTKICEEVRRNMIFGPVYAMCNVCMYGGTCNVIEDTHRLMYVMLWTDIARTVVKLKREKFM